MPHSWKFRPIFPLNCSHWFHYSVLQLPNVIPSLHLNYGVLAVASGTDVITYDTSQGTLKQLSVSGKGT